jgi:ABC-2 type transport system permease protein
VSVRVTVATALRVLRQLLRDPRTLALMLVVPPVLLALLWGMYADNEEVFNQIGGPLLGIFPLVTMFLVTSVAMLRERTTGTLERLLTLPAGKLDLLVGYGIAFGVLAVAQIALTSLVAFGPLGLETARSPVVVAAVALINALLGVAFGLFLSAFARTEFQAVQFMPAFVMPQLLLCGLFVPRDQMTAVLEAVSWALPMTYAYEALDRAVSPGSLGVEFAVSVLVTVGATLLALALGAATLQRRTI